LNGTAHVPPLADAIVVAAGASRRMGGTDKLSSLLAGRPLLAHTLEAFAAANDVASIVVVTAQERRDHIAEAPWLPAKVVAVVVGGATRQDSVAAGFAALEATVPDPAGQRIVLVHDGARPLVTRRLIAAVIDAARDHGAAIPVVPVVETVKRIEDGTVAETVDRETLGVAQTPQAFRRLVWRAATSDPIAASDTWTDEAALLEACRIPVHVVPGEPTNLKVTMPADVARAAALLGQGTAVVRTGIGQDSHPFGPGSPLMLGGIAIEGAPRLAGHSDGDVVLHAVADALLGAAALGDLGRHFPAGPETPAGAASVELLASVVATLRATGWRAVAVDLTIIGARPRLGARLDEMRAAIAALIGTDLDAVGVKASTGNLIGPEGAGRSVSALAIATIERSA
jgi:2-C-methyl-D-erythritol 4-phosphate cytidylyltransferase / 2-C-methyl-D-erythritol 2,4-cyclodiphosphate synthase